jgi:hypothetical protein
MHKDCAVLQRYHNCEGCYAHPTEDYEEPLVEGMCEKHQVVCRGQVLVLTLRAHLEG